MVENPIILIRQQLVMNLICIPTEVQNDAKPLNVVSVGTPEQAPLVLDLLLVHIAHHLWVGLLHLLVELEVEAHSRLLTSLVVLVVSLALLLNHILFLFLLFLQALRGKFGFYTLR